jgi:polygalacturonase
MECGGSEVKRIAVVLVVVASVLKAQDTRIVKEPVIPVSCVVLLAMLTGPIAVADEQRLDTDRLQKAIDGCGPGKAVELASDGTKDAFLAGPIELKTGVTLLVDRGVTLYGSRDPKVYEKSPGSCGKVDHEKGGCRPLISASHAPGIGIMGDGVIDGRGGEKLIVDGKVQAKSWWDLAEDARAGGSQEVPRLITTESCDNLTIYRITLKNSANFHVVPHHSDGITVWGMKIDTPIEGARNTDGFDPSASTNITVTRSFIRDGDDNIAIKGGDGPVTHMTVSHDRFYWGHGMSIGSETNGGVSDILVTDLSLDGTTSGIRIKSNITRGGLVHDVTYDNVCIRKSKTPIDIDTAYVNPGAEENKYPVFEDITLHNVRISGGGTIKLNGYDATHRIGIRFDGVFATDGASAYKDKVAHADITLGPGPVNLTFHGEDSTVKGAAVRGTAESCAAMFVPFPEGK